MDSVNDCCGRLGVCRCSRSDFVTTTTLFVHVVWGFGNEFIRYFLSGFSGQIDRPAVKRILLSWLALLAFSAHAVEQSNEPTEDLVWSISDYEAETGAKWRTVEFDTIPGAQYELQSSGDLENWTSRQIFYGLGHNLKLSLFELQAPSSGSEDPEEGPGEPEPLQVHFMVRPSEGGGLILTWRSIEDGRLIHHSISGSLDEAWEQTPLYFNTFSSHSLFVGAMTSSPEAAPTNGVLAPADAAAVSTFTTNLATMNADVAANLAALDAPLLPPPPSSEDRKFYRLKRVAIDSDGDGVADWLELSDLRTDPFTADTDGDGISDGDEKEAFSDPTNPLSGSSPSVATTAKEKFLKTRYAIIPLPGITPMGVTSGGQVVVNAGFSVWHRGVLTHRQDPIVDVTWNGYGLVRPYDNAKSSRIVDCRSNEDGFLEEGTELSDLPSGVVEEGLTKQYQENDPYFVGLKIKSLSQTRRGSWIGSDGSVMGTVYAEAELEVEFLLDLEESETEKVDQTAAWIAPMVLWESPGSTAKIPKCYSSLEGESESGTVQAGILDYSDGGGVLAQLDQGYCWSPSPSSGNWHRVDPHFVVGLEKHGRLAASSDGSSGQGVLRMGAGMQFNRLPAVEAVHSVSRHGVVGGTASNGNGAAIWRKFEGQWVALHLNEACVGGEVGNYRLILSDDAVDDIAPDMIVGTHNGDAMDSAVLLVKVELLATTAANLKPEAADWFAYEDKPRPEVHLQIDHAEVLGSDGDPELHVALSGFVKDPLSSFSPGSAGRVTKLDLSAGGKLLKSIPVGVSVGTQFNFQETLVIPGASAGALTIRATTGVNGVGQQGWDQAAVGMTYQASPTPGEGDDVTLSFEQAPDATQSDSLKIYFGNRNPTSSDGSAVEGAADSNRYVGTLKAAWEGQDVDLSCEVVAVPQGSFSTTTKDRLGVEIRYRMPNGLKNSLYGYWEETAPDSELFRASGITTGDEVLGVSGVREMHDSHKTEGEVITFRAKVPASWEGSNGLKFGIGGQKWEMRRMAVHGIDGYYPVTSGEAETPKYFLPGSGQVPEHLAIPGFDNESEGFDIQLGFADDMHVIGNVMVLPAEPDVPASAAPPMASPPVVPQGPVVSNNETKWQEPGDEVSWNDMITAYKFIYGENQKAWVLLDAYLSSGNHISLEDVSGDLDVSYMMRVDGKILIKIENDDDDVHPASCASMLYVGLHRALAYPPLAGHQDILDDLDLFVQSRRAFADTAREMTIVAAELYLSGIGMTNEVLDWVLVINDVSEGHFEALAATLPLVSSGLVKTTGSVLKVKNLAGDVLASMDFEKLEALVKASKSPDVDIETLATLARDYELNDFMLRMLSSKGGNPKVQAPSSHKGLKSKMKIKHGPCPDKFRVHHDLPWEFRDWFARRGFDVNDARFGRYIHFSDHKLWHSGEGLGRGGPFNTFWREFIAQERILGRNRTSAEIFEKLGECRQQFAQTILP